jgi:hypothetical protein
MKAITHFSLLILTVILWSSAYAQTGGGGVSNEEVIVVKEYEASIQDAQKITIAPSIPDIQEKAPTFNYSIPTKDYKDFSFEANPLKPIGVSKEKFEKYNTSFIKFGFGSQLTPLAQLAYNDNKAKNIKFGIFYNHLSARGFNIKNQQFSDDEVGAYFKYVPQKIELSTAFTFHNYRTHFYGIDTLVADTTVKAKDIRQVFRNYDAAIYLKNSQQNKLGINYRQTLNFNYLQERFGKANEWFVFSNTSLDKIIAKQHGVSFDFNFDISRLKADSTTLQRNIFRLMPGYFFDNDDWEVRGKVGLAIDGKKVFPLADVHVEKRLYQHSIIAFVGYQLKYEKNSLLSLLQANNFVRHTAAIQSSSAGDFNVGVKGAVQKFDYNASFHLHHIDNFLLFVNDTNDLRRFNTVYDKAIIYNVIIQGAYQVKEWLRFKVIGDYRFFEMKNQAKAWHEPNLKVTFGANYIWKNKISVGIDLYGITNTNALLSNGEIRSIKGVADLNLNVEYLMNKKISFFGMLNNIAHQRYQRWYNYPSFGINGLVGAKFSF